MKAIGGYFELELRKDDLFPHAGAKLVNSGRNAFEYILRVMERTPDVVWLPYYTCDVMLQPLRRLNIHYEFYHINESFEVEEWPRLGENDYIVITNYFGIKDDYVLKLYFDKSKKHHLIIDNSQAWFATEHLGLKEFYSPRKFFGVPDGGVAWTPVSKILELEESTSFESCSHLLKRIDVGAQEGYGDFRKNEEILDNMPLKAMSVLTRALLSNIDYDYVKFKRRSNYEYLSYFLDSINLLTLPKINSFECPMVYPFRTVDLSLRKRLIENNIFVAKYWPNVRQWCMPESLEYQLAQDTVYIPIDQRYGEEEMKLIIKTIKA